MLVDDIGTAARVGTGEGGRREGERAEERTKELTEFGEEMCVAISVVGGGTNEGGGGGGGVPRRMRRAAAKSCSQAEREMGALEKA